MKTAEMAVDEAVVGLERFAAEDFDGVVGNSLSEAIA